jgi:hypothetical protein
MHEQCSGHTDTYVRGSFISIVKENGDFLSYPPLHMHVSKLCAPILHPPLSILTLCVPSFYRPASSSPSLPR